MTIMQFHTIYNNIVLIYYISTYVMTNSKFSTYYFTKDNKVYHDGWVNIMKKDTKVYKIISAAAYIFMVLFSIITCCISTPVFASPIKISRLYPNLFLPSPLTFNVWTIIYILLALMVANFLELLPGKPLTVRPQRLQYILILFTVTCLLNVSWVSAWDCNYLALSLMLVIIMSICILMILKILNREDLARREKLLIRLPFSIFYAWINYMIVAVIMILLVSIGWQETPDGLWTMAAIAVLTLAAFCIAYQLKDIVYCLTFLWVYAGILVRHISAYDLNGKYPYIIAVTIICSVLLAGEAVYLFLSGKYNN